MMKKIIAAALSILVGAFGYTIVDSAIENRVATLESEVVELREIISDYHKNITETIFTTISDNTKTSTQNPTTTKPLTPLQNWLVENHVAGYEYEPDGDFFYIDDEACWQSGKGYNEFYDKYAPAAAMFIDQIRIRFTYENKDWMIQLWKGQYGWLFVGAETGVYTAPAGTYKGGNGDANHYDCADKDDWLDMQLDCYFSKNNDGHYKKIFTRPYDKYWWVTGFVWGQLTKYSKPRTELKAKNRITFKSEEMATLFAQGLREAGFIRAVDEDNLVDDSYYQNGKDVWLLWTSIQSDKFVGYDETSLTTAVPTTYPDSVVTRPSGVTAIDEGSTTQRPTTTQIYY
ncbi:MAG: DUF4474 domain-containing protein [Clostridia bacterium]|nr:DUF4474 domain-containing protein [Clostridia bacterium]